MSNIAPLSPRDIAERCRAEAHSVGISNMTAIVLMLAGKALDETLDRAVALAAINERMEAKS